MMGLGDKVIAASNPKEEGEEKNPESPGEDCFCVCFCEEEEENFEDGKEKKDCSGEGEEEEESPELVDPLTELKQQCGEKPDCAKYKQKLDECTARVESRTKTSETCAEELIDFMHCVDHCASKTLFSKLK